MSNEHGYTRSEAREQAFMLLFSNMFDDEPFELKADDNAELYEHGISPYASAVVSAIEGCQGELDNEISRFLKKGWSVSRISKPSLAILRLAFYEIKNVDKIPSSVSINEAVELAKKYTIDDYKFINGVLGAYVRSFNSEAE